tara:strand:- start:145 stop:978 length:834 start_codon:yes stop_codon:yes gene_type:complete
VFLKIIIFFSKLTFLKKNIFLKKFLKNLAKNFARLIYGKSKKIKILNKYTFLINSKFAFSNFENFHNKHNKGFKKLLDISNNTKIVFDIGAHIGLCTLPLTHLTNRVFSFEASPTNQRYLKNHININNCSNVTIVPYLVGKKNNDNIDFYDTGDGSGIPSIVNLKFKKKNIVINHIKIKQINLDNFVKENSIIPDVIKIDVEGSEFNILDGAKLILKSYRPKIIISLHPEHLKFLNRNVSEIYDYCEKYSYELLSCIDEHLILKDELALDEYFMRPK